MASSSSYQLKHEDKLKPVLTTDPKIIGPGTWFTIHIMAMSCGDEDSCLFFIQFIKVVIESFPCEDCRKHAAKFIESNPPERYIHMTNDIDEYIGMFKWSWEFHNSANHGLNKPKISFADAWELYSSSSTCQGNCGSEPQEHKQQDLPKLKSTNRLINGSYTLKGSLPHNSPRVENYEEDYERRREEDTKINFSHDHNSYTPS